MESMNAVGARVAVLGLGYVGCVSAACLAQLGHTVVGIDKDEHKVRAINNGVPHFYEPGLAAIVSETVAAGRLSASMSLTETLAGADVALICVGTPSERNGNLGLGQLHSVCSEIAYVVAQRRKPLVIAIRSTVFPGTCEEIARTAFRGIDVESRVSAGGHRGKGFPRPIADSRRRG